MSLKSTVRRYAITQAIQWLLPVLARRRDENLITLTRLYERIATDPTHKLQMQQLRGLFERKHPALELARRIATELHPQCRRGLLRNLVLNTLYLTTGQRKARKAQGLAAPYLLVLSPTMRCNLRCYGCYAGEYTKQDDLPLEVADRIITEAKALGTYFFTITGGEPFVWKEKLFSLFRKHPDACFQIYTNGTLIDEEVAAELVEVGNAAPAISVEGFAEETDARRGAGTFEKILHAMDCLREARAFFGFSGTVTSHNVDVISSDEFIDLLIDKGCYYGWYFVYIPIGRAPDTSLMPTPEQRQRLRERTWSIRDRKPILVADFWNDGRLTGGCMAGGRIYAHVNNRGDLEPCVFAHFATDNLKEKSLEEALESPFFKAIRGRFPWTDSLLTPCMIIDHPHVLREAVAEGGARPTHDGAETIIEDLAPTLDDYAATMKAITAPLCAQYGQPFWPDNYQEACTRPG